MRGNTPRSPSTSATRGLRAFRVAGITSVNLVTEVHQAIERAIADGTTLDDFKREVGAKLTEAWGAPNAARLETIFRTNVQAAYNAGRFAELSRPAMRAVRPFWKYVAILDGRTTATCAPLQGAIRPHDDDFWRTHWPPLHFNCRSTVVSLSRAEAARAGGATPVPKAAAPGEGFGTRPDLAGEALRATEKALGETKRAMTERSAPPAPPPAPPTVTEPSTSTDGDTIRISQEDQSQAIYAAMQDNRIAGIVTRMNTKIILVDEILTVSVGNGEIVQALAVHSWRPDIRASSITISQHVHSPQGVFRSHSRSVDRGAATPADACTRVFTHEVGHALLHDASTEEISRLATIARKRDAFNAVHVREISGAGRHSEDEFFAECFSAYIHEPAVLEDASLPMRTLIRDMLIARGIEP